MNVERYQATFNFSTYIYRIAYNLAIDMKRRDKKMIKVHIESKEPSVLKGLVETESDRACTVVEVQPDRLMLRTPLESRELLLG